MLTDMMKFREGNLSGFKVIKRTLLRRDLVMVKVLRTITQKVLTQELWFLHSAHPLMLVDICMKFYNASLNGLKVIERTRWRQDFVMDTVPREITLKV